MEQKEKLRNYIIAVVKRLQVEVKLLKSVAKLNEKVLDSSGDFVIQLERVNNELQAVLDYNFYPDEIKGTEPYETEYVIVKE